MLTLPGFQQSPVNVSALQHAHGGNIAPSQIFRSLFQVPKHNSARLENRRLNQF